MCIRDSCYSDPSQEWAYVSVGNRYGYMKTEFLYFGSDPESIPPQTPIAYAVSYTHLEPQMIPLFVALSVEFNHCPVSFHILYGEFASRTEGKAI